MNCEGVDQSLKLELAKKEKELSILYRVNQSLASGYMEHLLSLVVHLVHEFLDCDRCSINILDEKRKLLVARAAYSEDLDFYQVDPVKVDQSLSGIAVLEHRTCQWTNITKEEKFAYPEMAKKLGLNTLLAVPMIVKSKVVGVINFYSKNNQKFKDDQVKFLEILAGQVAISIQRQNLVNEVNDSKRLLEERKLVERAKSVLMERKSIGENDAYQLMRKTSMSSRKPMAEIAKAILFVEEI